MILITGGAGYIGSHTAVELLKAGYDVFIVDDFSNSDKAVLNRIEQITGRKPYFAEVDIKEERDLFDAINGKAIDAIIHFAAYKAVGESVQKPIVYYRNNIVTLLNVIEAMKRFNIVNLVFSSSSTVYGQPDQLPVTEASPLKTAQSPYGKSKQMCEEIIKDCCSTFSAINAIALRYFNPIGADESGLIGELPRGIPNNLVPFITQTAAGLRKELNVYGNDYPTTDGTAIRDYIHVSDLADAHIAALKRLLDKKQVSSYEAFNVGTGKGLSVLEIINSFERVNNIKLNYKVAPRRPGDVEQIYADTSMANRVLQWTAKRTVEDMMATAWKWQSHLMNQ